MRFEDIHECAELEKRAYPREKSFDFRQRVGGWIHLILSAKRWVSICFNLHFHTRVRQFRVDLDPSALRKQSLDFLIQRRILVGGTEPGKMPHIATWASRAANR